MTSERFATPREASPRVVAVEHAQIPPLAPVALPRKIQCVFAPEIRNGTECAALKREGVSYIPLSAERGARGQKARMQGTKTSWQSRPASRSRALRENTGALLRR